MKAKRNIFYLWMEGQGNMIHGLLHCCYYLWFSVAAGVGMVGSSPPAEVVKCEGMNINCTVSNGYGAFPDRSTCRAAEVVYPETEEEVLAVVGRGSQKNQKMRVVSTYSHSIPKLVCPGGDHGLIISTQRLNRVLCVDNSTMTMSVEGGTPLKDVIDGAARAGLALGHSPYWLGVTVGGLLSTGAHGSSLISNGSAVHEYVLGMRLVVPAPPREGFAKVVPLTRNHPDLNAAKVSLGLLGVISQVTLQLQPMFKRSITNAEETDADLEDRIVQFGSEYEFGDVTWYPSQHKVVYRMDGRVPTGYPGDGENQFTGFCPQLTAVLRVIRDEEEVQEAVRNADAKCVSSEIQVSTLVKTGGGLKRNRADLLAEYPVIGYQNKLQASGLCLASPEDGLLMACPWDPRIKGEFFHQTTVTIALSKIKDFVLNVKALRDLNPITSLCGVDLYNGFLMRYVKASSAYLGKEEDSVDVDITYYRSHDPVAPRLYEDVLEEIEQMALFKYGGLPHWGKNRNLAFDGVMKKYSRAAEFLKAKHKYDPRGLFSSEWTDGVLGISGRGVIIEKNGCALEGLCVCSEDVHCAPASGYFCRPGRVYTDARVCRLDPQYA